MTHARAMLAGRKHAPARLGDVCVLGLGVSGRAVADYLLAQPQGRVSSLTIFTGDAPASPETDALAKAGCRIVFSDHVEGAFDLAIASPGISERSGFYLSGKEASRELVSEVELAWRESASSDIWVGVTGTNGKTTTTALLAHVLSQAGFAAKACGNIGDACIHAVADGAPSEGCAREGARVFVAEVSSYQLASIQGFAPDAAIFLGVTPDHLAWHGSFQAYADAKWRMLRNMERSGGVAVLDAVDEVTREQVKRLRKAALPASFSYIPIGARAGIEADMRRACGARNAAFVDEAGRLLVAHEGVEHALIGADELQIKGPHNIVNALAAASAALALGADEEQVTRALADFQPLAHRIEPVASVAGVGFFNDSKATNVDATLVALRSFPGRSLVVMLGGRDKMGPLDGLVRACADHASAVVLFGEAAERFACAFDEGAPGKLRVAKSGGFDDAFRTACDLVAPGGVVLLSPACASFDEFSCFEERGDHFKELVFAHAQAAG